MELEAVDRGLVEFIFNQGVGIAFGIAMLVALVIERKGHNKEKAEVMARMENVLRERKTDRDTLLTMMGRIDTHLARADAFEEFAREVVGGGRPHPKRRLTDRLVAEALAKASLEEDPG